MVKGNRYEARAYWMPREDSRNSKRPVQTGICIYVHPQKRFCTLLFDGGVRASYYPGEIRYVQ